MFLCQVYALREIICDVVQLPFFLRAIERHHAESVPRHSPMETRRNPPIVIYRTVTKHLEILRGAR